jgi:hypothetical protein
MKNIVKGLFFFLNLLIYNVSAAQSNYSKYVSKAELNFIDKKYDSALHNYSFAFNSRKNVFAKDYYNAALCAVRLNKFSKADEYLTLLCKAGFDIIELKKAKAFKLYTVSANYQKIVLTLKKRDTDTITQEKKNQNYFEELLKDDQYFRIKNSGDYIHHEYAGIIKQIDSINVGKIEQFIEKNGFPNEFNCGVKSDFLCYSPIEILIIHQQFGSPTRVKNFSETILVALQKEEVLPHMGINLYYTSAGVDSLFGHCFFKLEQPDGTFKHGYYAKFKNGVEEKYNANRLNYNAEILDDYRKKVIYWIKNEDFLFDFTIGVDIQVFGKAIAPHIKNVTFVE